MVRRPRHGAAGIVEGMNLTTSPRADSHHPEIPESPESGVTQLRWSAKFAGRNWPTAVFAVITPVHLPSTRPATNSGTSTQPRQSVTFHTAPATMRNSRCTGRSR